VFPILDVVLDEAHRHDGREKFVKLALADTDRRVGEDKPVAPSYMLACMLWHDVQAAWEKNKQRGESAFPALQQAIDAVFDARIGDISGRGKLAADMREIWQMQPRFERRTGTAPFTLVEQPRFRAGFDFLRLRGEAGEIDPALAQWWEAFSLADAEERERLMASVRGSGVRRAPAVKAAAQPDEEPEDAGPSAPARKRRRRRRKPAGEGAAAATDAGSAD
jgi:poly(A) polymerase